jgi:hypothetical protein
MNDLSYFDFDSLDVQVPSALTSQMDDLLLSQDEQQLVLNDIWACNHASPGCCQF